jgi:mycofactocin system FadH/OYE family oxidoreductase 2
VTGPGASTASAHPLLDSPVRLGPVTAPNRVVFAAHLTNYALDGLPGAQHAAYYGARAAGGAGLVITEEHSVHPGDRPYEKLIRGHDPAVLPGYRALTAAVHRQGVPVFAQLNHNGGQSSSVYSRVPVWAPSAVADPMFREVPLAMDAAQITELVRAYADVAARCRAGGFDGVEIQASQASLVRGFLAPATNLRTDGYGGPLAHRVRFLLEVLTAVRGAVGPGVALGVRLSADDLVRGGITVDEAVEVAVRLEESGLVDYLNTSIGVATSTLWAVEPSMAMPRDYARHAQAAVRSAVSLPVVAVGRFTDAAAAEQALQDGYGDLVGVVRGQIADASFAATSRPGSAGTVRGCLSCNQECVGRVGLNRPLACVVAPGVGRESLPLATATRRRRRVLVAGAGPAGLQAALTAAGRGHDVTLHEASPTAGGQVLLAAALPGREQFGDLVRHQLSECARLGVDVVTDSTVDPALVRGRRPDVVVVATGSRPIVPAWLPGLPLGGAPAVTDVRAVVAGRVEPRGRVLVVDELGFHHATGVAERLADRGCAVEIVTVGMVVAQDLGLTLDLELWWGRATAKGIAQTTDTLVTGLVPGGVTLLDVATGAPARRDVDWVVVAGHGSPVDELYLALRVADDGTELHRIGDCLAPRRADAAVRDGDRVGALL